MRQVEQLSDVPDAFIDQPFIQTFMKRYNISTEGLSTIGAPTETVERDKARD